MVRLGIITVIIAIVGALLSGLAALRVHDQEIAVDRIAFSRAIDVHASLVQERMSERELLARVASSLFRSPSIIEPNMLEPLRASIYAFKTDFVTATWMARIKPDEIPAAQAAMRAAGFKGDVREWNDAPRDVSTLKGPVDLLVDVEPRSANSVNFLGRTYDNHPVVGPALAKAREQGQPIASDPIPLLRKKGTPGVILVAPVRNDASEIAGFITFSFEIASLMLANDDMSLFGVVLKDPVNPSLELIANEGDRAVVSRPAPTGGPAPLVRMVSFGKHDWSLAYYAKVDAEARAFRLAAVAGSLGLALTAIVCGLFGYVVSNNLRLRREIDVRIGYERRLTAVIDELNHRVKNILAVIQSIITRTLRHGGDIDSGRELLIGRIHAMSNVVSLLSESQWQGVPIKGLLEARSLPNSERISASGPNIVVSARAAQNLSLLFYELASHTDEGFSAVGKHPTVIVQWEEVGHGPESMFHFRWEEFNTSEQTRRPESEFGQVLLDRVAPEGLGGTSRRFFSEVSYVYELDAPMKSVIDLQERDRTDQIVAPLKVPHQEMKRPK